MSDVTKRTDGNPDVAWWRAAAIIGVALIAAIVGADIFWLLVEPVTLVLVAIIIAQALSPIAAFAERWLPHGIAVITVYLALILLISGVGWIVVPIVISESQALVSDAPSIMSQLRSWFDATTPGVSVDQVIDWVGSRLQQFSDRLVALPMTIFTSLIDLVLVVFMSAYWLIATPALHRFTLSLFPEDQRQWVGSVMDDMGRTMGGFVRGTFIDALIIGVLSYVGLLVIGVEYVLLLAVISGFGELIPIVGPILATIPAVLVAFIDSPQQALVVLIFYLVLQQIESNLVVPLVMRNQADVPPLLSLVAVVVGTALGGLLAAVLAIPLFGALRILVLRVLAPAERDWTGVEDAPSEIGTDPDDGKAG